ncbi:ATP-binding protein [Catalinimonas niigatensis]|uniref:ATP-binding protein n=1 Tax=Catalinimonas niigatensis TaxID=1397264 RepID=UPI0026651AC5|nr:ATP-binding protein [Catalinimonas niigatensis]WPP48849.1 ATP-binding protein [Catalinimonas niigatensis]
MNYSFKVPCCKDRLQSIRDFVANILANYNLSEVDAHQLVLAVDEVCANLMIHSHHCNPKESIELIINIEEGAGITFEIRDEGAGFDICDYKEPNLNDIIGTKRKGGIGLMLVRRIMDHIEFDCCAKKQHNIYRLRKSISFSPKPPLLINKKA